MDKLNCNSIAGVRCGFCVCVIHEVHVAHLVGHACPHLCVRVVVAFSCCYAVAAEGLNGVSFAYGDGLRHVDEGLRQLRVSVSESDGILLAWPPQVAPHTLSRAVGVHSVGKHMQDMFTPHFAGSLFCCTITTIRVGSGVEMRRATTLRSTPTILNSLTLYTTDSLSLWIFFTPIWKGREVSS